MYFNQGAPIWTVYSQDSSRPFIACPSVQGTPIYNPPGSGATCPSESASTKISSTASVNVKVLNPVNKKEFSMYTLRDISLEDFQSPESLKETVVTRVSEATIPKVRFSNRLL